MNSKQRHKIVLFEPRVIISTSYGLCESHDSGKMSGLMMPKSLFIVLQTKKHYNIRGQRDTLCQCMSEEGIIGWTYVEMIETGSEPILVS